MATLALPRRGDRLVDNPNVCSYGVSTPSFAAPHESGPGLVALAAFMEVLDTTIAQGGLKFACGQLGQLVEVFRTRCASSSSDRTSARPDRSS